MEYKLQYFPLLAQYGPTLNLQGISTIIPPGLPKNKLRQYLLANFAIEHTNLGVDSPLTVKLPLCLIKGSP